MRSLAVLAALAIASPLAAQDDPDRAVEGGGNLPDGWSARADRGRPLDNVNFRTMGDGFHITLGPALILWRAADAAMGDHGVTARFRQTRAPTHPEAYGLFVGGSDLDGAGQSYVYFLIRGNGQFLVKRRTGAETETLAAWTAHDAVAAQNDAGASTNTLSVRVSQGTAHFMVNGTEVWSGAIGTAGGMVGLRVNHNLDLHIDQYGGM